MTIVIIGGVGYYLYAQYTSPAKFYDYEYVILSNEQPITPPVSLQGLNSSSARRGKMSIINKEVDYSSTLSTIQLPTSDGTPSSSLSSGRLLSARSSTYSAKTEKTPAYSIGSTTSAMLTFGSNSARKSSYTTSTDESGGFYSISGGASSLSTKPFAVPFAKDAVTIAVVDPGGDPNEDEMIPVGEGWWILLLLAGAYGIFRRKSLLT